VRIYNPGNAFCICQNTECTATFLVDPWIAKKAYADGWIPPVYTKNLQGLVKELGEIDFILITHIHEDHLDEEFLRHYANTNTKIIFPRVLGWKYIESIAHKHGFEDQLHIINFNEKLRISDLNIRAVPPVNTANVNGSDKIGDHALSIDAGFIVTDKYDKNIAFMADNNPYNLNALKKAFDGFGKISLFCIAHSGFASDYPYHYGYNREDCLQRYTRLECSRQEKQLENILLAIKPEAILSYSSSFLPNAWVDQNWWECAEDSKYFKPESAASEYEKITSIKSFGLNTSSFLDLVKMKKYFVSRDNYFNRVSCFIHDSFVNPKLAQEHTVSCGINHKTGNTNYDKLVDDSKKNFHEKANMYKLAPLHEIRILVDDGTKIVLKRASNLENHRLTITLSRVTLLWILSGKLYWDSAMLSFLLYYKREPDFYCSNTYNALLNFFSPTRS